MLPRIRRIFTLVTGILLAAMLAWPFHDGYVRYGLPGLLGIVWLAGLGCLWKQPLARFLVLCLPVLAVVPFLLPGKPIDPSALRQAYVEALRGFEGTRYLWGGESHRGIDCSGLPRRALREALWREGLRHGNGAAFRLWAEQWWYDTSAKALGEGYRGFTRPLGRHGAVRSMETRGLLPGDLAVTSDGRHVIVFLEPGKWIQADPVAFKVTIRDPTDDWNPWFAAPAAMHRWSLLE